MRIGQHALWITSPSVFEYRKNSVIVRPGSAFDMHIVCPVPPEQTDVGFDLGLPDDLREKDLWIVLGFNTPPRKVDGWEWSALSTVVMLNTKGQIIETISEPRLVEQLAADDSEKAIVDILSNDWTGPLPPERRTQTRLPCVDFTLTSLSIVQPGVGPTFNAQKKRATYLGTLPMSQRFRPEPENVNRWTIALPNRERFFEEVRERLAKPQAQPSADK